MKRFLIAVGVLCLPSGLFGAYTPYHAANLAWNALTNWTVNGSVSTVNALGLEAPSATGGSIISNIAVPDGTSEYEVKSILTLSTFGGTYVSYLRASPDALSGPSPAGTY